MPTVFLLPATHHTKVLELASEAARRAFADVTIHALPNVDAALLDAPRDGTVLLVLLEPEMAEVRQALEAVTADALPRWACAILGGAIQGGFEVVPEEEWSVPLLARVFRAAVVNHELALENARFRGDLHTLGRRFAHDLRTPLSGIFSTAELLREVLHESAPEDSKLVTPLYDSTQSLLRLIDRVSFLLKATVEPRPKEAVDMGSVFWAGRQAVERQLAAQKASLAEPAAWPLVLGVPVWLEVIWSDLLGNAVRHGGAPAVITAGWRKEAAGTRFWVRDQGAGVPPARVPLLFQPFHRLHQRNTAPGLGLPIVQRLVDLQGGECGYEPAEGGGALFYFTLPGEPAAPA